MMGIQCAECGSRLDDGTPYRTSTAFGRSHNWAVNRRDCPNCYGWMFDAGMLTLSAIMYWAMLELMASDGLDRAHQLGFAMWFGKLPPGLEW